MARSYLKLIEQETDAEQVDSRDAHQVEVDRIAALDRERNERDRRVGRGYDYAPGASGVVELTYVEPHQPREMVKPVDPQFPACRKCRSRRFWIAASGKVVCGNCGEVCYILAKIEFHPIN